MTYSATCLCGSIELTLTLPKDISSYTPRACDCDFCIDRDLNYLSDPEGHLLIQSKTPMNKLKQGTEQATFLECLKCEKVVAVICYENSLVKGAVSAELFREKYTLAKAQSASPKLLSATEKRERWRKLWLTVELSQTGH